MATDRTIVATILIFVGLSLQSNVSAAQTGRFAQNQPPGEAADPTPPRPRASPAEHSNQPTSASSPAQPGSTPTTETGVGTTVDKPAGNTDKKQ
jgi:hypothetical protein